jgi:hypothetical protein
MNLTETSKCREGRDLWAYYVKINGYAKEATEDGLQRISRLLDLNVPYIRHRINLYLEA